MSVEVNCDKFIVRELEGYQSLHQWDSISYNPIEPIDDYRDYSRAHAFTRVASPAMLMPALFLIFLRSLSDQRNRSCKERKRAHSSNEVHLRRIRVDLHDTHDSHLAMPLMAVPIAITFYKTQWNYLRYGWCQEFTAAATEVLQDYIRINGHSSRQWSSDRRSCGTSVREVQ